MKRLTSILAISVIAVMSAGAARADIASTTYVDNKVSPVSTKASTNATAIATLQSGKQDKLNYTAENVANKVVSGGNMETALKAADADTKYPTLKAAMEIAQVAAGAVNEKLGELASKDSVSNALAGKQDKLVSSGANANISGSNGVTVTVGTDGKITVSGNKSAIDTALAGKQDKLSTAQAAAANSGITSDKVSKYDGYDATINANTSAAAAAKTAADTAQATANKAVVANAAITAGTGTKITYDAKGLVTGSTSLAASDIPALATSKITGLDTTLANKQAKLNDTQLNAVNSGITSAKVTTYEGYSAKITTAQNTANTAKTTAEAAIAAPAANTISTDGLYTLTMKVVDGTKTYAWEKIGR